MSNGLVHGEKDGRGNAYCSWCKFAHVPPVHNWQGKKEGVGKR